MRRSPNEVKALLRQLADRDWPPAWGAEQRGDDYLGWSHKYLLNPPVPLDEIEAFERKHGVRLPIGYRRFLQTIGNGGAGPGFGLHPLNAADDVLQHYLTLIAEEFDPDEAEDWEGWDDSDGSDDVMRGTIPIVENGCGNWFHLVVTGDNAGEIWYDARGGDHEPPESVAGEDGPMQFDEWYESWLDSCEAKWLPLTASRKRKS